jgi:hypothetical protein
MSRNIQRSIYAALSIAVAVVLFCHADTCTDEELRHDVLEFLTTRCCGRVEARRVLTNEIRFDGDTNRLARILAECAQTNDERVVESALEQLVKYGTFEQLPFLYSCVTNSNIGDKAIKSILRIEGITSNSVAAVRSYLSFTNAITRQQAYDRAIASRQFLGAMQNSAASTELKAAGFRAVRAFAADINTSNSVVDEALIAADDTYRYSKRRLAVMRAAYPRCFNEYQTNYVTNAINELVAYPEANLPD